MKALILSLGLLTLTACGSSGGGSSPASAVNQPAPIVPGEPSCKPLNSVWQSTTNHERHDLTNLPVSSNFDNTTWPSYAFAAGSTGERCPYPGQPQTAMISDTHANNNTVAYNAGFNYILSLHNLYPSVACSTYQNPGQQYDGTTTGGAYMKFECNKLTMCRLYNDASTCTVFN